MAKDIINFLLKHEIFDDTFIYVNDKRYGTYDGEGHETYQGDLFYDSDEIEQEASDRNARDIIQNLLNKNKIVEGIILDAIAYNDTSKITKEVKTSVDTEGKEYSYTNSTTEFWSYRLVQVLSTLPENYFDYFFNKYDVKDVELETAISRIKSCNNQKLYKLVNTTLSNCRAAFATLWNLDNYQ